MFLTHFASIDLDMYGNYEYLDGTKELKKKIDVYSLSEEDHKVFEFFCKKLEEKGVLLFGIDMVKSDDTYFVFDANSD